MSLEFIIKQIVLEKGQDFLTNKYFLNYISDYDNKVFNPPALKSILKTIINDGYANELLSSGKDNVQVTINSITSKLSNLYGYSEDNTKYLLNCLAFGLGWIRNIEEPNPKSEGKMEQEKSSETIDYSYKTTTTNTSNTINLKSQVVKKTTTTNTKTKSDIKKHIKNRNNKVKNSKNSCFSTLLFFLALFILGGIINYCNSDNKDDKNESNNTQEPKYATILLPRTEKDTIKAKDGTPIELADVTKNDIKLVLDTDSLTLITPYECAYPSIGFKDGPTNNFYNKITKEFKEELVYEFQFAGKTKDSFIYKLDKKIFPSFGKQKKQQTVEGGGRLCDVFFFYVPKRVADQNYKSYMKKMKFDSYINLDVHVEGSGCSYKKTFYSYDYYEKDNEKLKQYFFN